MLENLQSCIRLATKTKDTCKVGSSRCDVSSDLFSLVKKETLASMAYFLLGFCKTFWKTHFNIMEQHDPIVQKSGCIARHVAVQFYVMCKELDALESSYKHNDEFLPFLNRQNIHSTEEQVKLCSKLTPYFFTEEKRMIRKHFT